MRTLRYVTALIATNLKSAFALRGAFWIQAGFMVMNNLIFFSVWWIFFQEFDEVRGWRLADMALLYGTVAIGFGASVLFGGGVRELARTISEGDLDPLLTQPKPVLLGAVLSRCQASGWGDLASGAALVGLSGHVHWETLPWVLLAPVAGAVVLTSTGILAASLAFWLGPVTGLARQVWEFTVTFSVYPPSIHGTAVRILVFTLLPAGFVSHMPVDLVRSFSWPTLLAVVGGAALYAGLALWVFHLGLRRYESGSRFGVRV